jgi:hypothetical protein
MVTIFAGNVDARTIISQLYTSGKLRQIARQLATADLAQDLEHEIVIRLLEKPPEKIEAMHAAGYLNFYIVRMAINLYRSNNSRFQRDYRHYEHHADINSQQIESTHEEYDDRADMLYEKAVQCMDNWAKPGQYPYDKQLFLLWLDLGNKKLIERKTKIPWRSISYTINNCKEKLKYELGPDYYNAFGHYDWLGDDEV